MSAAWYSMFGSMAPSFGFAPPQLPSVSSLRGSTTTAPSLNLSFAPSGSSQQGNSNPISGAGAPIRLSPAPQINALPTDVTQSMIDPTLSAAPNISITSPENPLGIDDYSDVSNMGLPQVNPTSLPTITPSNGGWGMSSLFSSLGF